MISQSPVAPDIKRLASGVRVSMRVIVACELSVAEFTSEREFRHVGRESHSLVQTTKRDKRKAEAGAFAPSLAGRRRSRRIQAVAM
jgi:hypothetical protein